MKLIWKGHSCFILESEGSRVVFDPYEPGSVPGCRDIDETADLVICSHGHHDHCYAKGVKIKADARPDIFKIVQTVIPHDEAGGSLRGMNTISVVETGGKKIVHFGDIGCQLSEEQEDLVKDADVIMIPVGGFYTVNAEEAAEIIRRIRPKAVIPMHFSGKGFGYDVISGVDKFTGLYDKSDVSYLDTDEVDPEKDLKTLINVMKFR